MKKRYNVKAVIPAILLVTALFAESYGFEPESVSGPPDPTVQDEAGDFSTATVDTTFENHDGTYPATLYYPEDGSDQYSASVPGPPDPTCLDKTGDFTAATVNRTFENHHGAYPATIYYPEDGSDQYPAVVFAHGRGANKNRYTWVGNHLASHGYIVLIFTVPRPFSVRTVQYEAGFVSAFELLKTENDNLDSPLFNHLDLNKTAIMGHSLGGLASLRAAETMRVDAVVALAPAREMQAHVNVTAPTQIQTATHDCITGEEMANALYELTIADTKQIIEINGGNHLQFCDGNIPADRRLIDCRPEVDTVNFHQRLSRRYFTAWLDYVLKGENYTKWYLFGRHAKQDFLSKHLMMWEYMRMLEAKDKR